MTHQTDQSTDRRGHREVPLPIIQYNIKLDGPQRKTRSFQILISSLKVRGWIKIKASDRHP